MRCSVKKGETHKVYLTWETIWFDDLLCILRVDAFDLAVMFPSAPSMWYMLPVLLPSVDTLVRLTIFPLRMQLQLNRC